MELLQALQKCPLIAILRGIQPQEVVAIGTALINQGFHCIEIPLNSPQPLESIALLNQAFQKSALIGAGTVTRVEQVAQVAERGAKLVVMPHTDITIIRAAKEQGLYCIPGFSTPTEAFAAINAGADALKLFPAPIPTILNAMKAVLPQNIPILPVGGITPAMLVHYLQAGASGFGLGSNLYQPGDSADLVTKNAKVFYDTIRQLS